MLRNLIQLMELAVEVSQATDTKVSFSFLPVAGIAKMNIYNTQQEFVFDLSNESMEQEIERAQNTLLDLVSEEV